MKNLKICRKARPRHNKARPHYNKARPCHNDLGGDPHGMVHDMAALALPGISATAGTSTHPLLLGASPSAISELLAPVLAGFLGNRPGLRCTLHDDIAETLAGMVSDGRLDLAVAGRAHSSTRCPPPSGTSRPRCCGLGVGPHRTVCGAPGCSPPS